MSAPFFTRRFYLDSTLKRGEKPQGEFYVGEFKSFWVSATNNANFSADLVVNFRDNSDRGLPLRLNQCQSFGNKVENCVIEVPVAQPGVWIDITFSQDEVLSVGSVAVSITGLVVVSEGSNHSSTTKAIDNTGNNVIFAAVSTTRGKGTFQNKGPGSIWVGNNTAAELLHANFKMICEEVTEGSSYEWKNNAQLCGKSDGSVNISVREEV